MIFDKPPVVIDNGSYTIKAGFACDNHPVSIFRSLVGRPSYLHGAYGREPYDVFIGDEAEARADDLDLNPPIKNGMIVQWDNMERIWHHCFYRELKAAPEDRAVMMTCAPTTPMKDKIKCCEVIFEALNNPALCIQAQSVLSLYGSGYTTGLCVDMGYDTTDIVPVYEGRNVTYAHMSTGIAGGHISSLLKQYLADRNIDLGKHAHDIIEAIKRDRLYLTKNCAMSRYDYKRCYKTPDGKEIDLSQEAFMAAEYLFNPDGVSGWIPTGKLSLQDAIVLACLKCDADLRVSMYEAVVPCGGLAMIPGMNDRLTVELEDKYDGSVNVIGSDEANVVSWLGGAAFAGLTGESQKLWITKKQYEDHGAKIVKNKF